LAESGPFDMLCFSATATAWSQTVFLISWLCNHKLFYMDELLPVNIVIGDRNYRIKVAASDEEMVRKTVKIINDKILDFKTNFAGKDMQDYVAMVLLWYATQVSSGSSAITENREVEDAIAKLNQQLEEVLSNEEPS